MSWKASKPVLLRRTQVIGSTPAGTVNEQKPGTKNESMLFNHASLVLRGENGDVQKLCMFKQVMITVVTINAAQMMSFPPFPPEQSSNSSVIRI